jgi:hypothetical protein
MTYSTLSLDVDEMDTEMIVDKIKAHEEIKKYFFKSSRV